MCTSMKSGARKREAWERSHELTLSRRFDAPLHRVWEAWTSRERLPLWLRGPAGWAMTTCELDLRVGGAWRISWEGGPGKMLRIEGVYEEVRAPERLVSTSVWGGDWPDTRETLVLAAEAGGTRVTQTTVYESEEALDAAVGNGVRDGMEQTFDDLAAYLHSAG